MLLPEKRSAWDGSGPPRAGKNPLPLPRPAKEFLPVNKGGGGGPSDRLGGLSPSRNVPKGECGKSVMLAEEGWNLCPQPLVATF